MNVPFFIARKVAAVGEKSFSRTIIRIAIAAVAVSIAVMVVSTSLVAGFKNQIKEKVFGFWGHIHISETNLDQTLLQVYPVNKNQPFYPHLDTFSRFPYPQEVNILGYKYDQTGYTNGGIRHIQVFAQYPGIIDTEEYMEGIILKGVDLDYDWAFLEEYMVEGEVISFSDSTMSRDILISKQTADRLDVEVGDDFIVYFVEGSNQIRRKFFIKGIFKTGLEEYDRNFAIIDIWQIQRLLGWSRDEVSGFEVFVDDVSDIPIIDEYIYYELLPNELRSETIYTKNPEIFEWLELQDINEVVILILMVVVAIINMVTATLILILERTNMIGTLKALGSSNWSIQKIFLFYAAYIIVLGLFIGNTLGIGLCVLQDQFEIIKLSEENYYLSAAPIELNFWPIFLVNLGTLLVTVAFLVIPSYLVTTVDPVKAIRFK